MHIVIERLFTEFRAHLTGSPHSRLRRRCRAWLGSPSFVTEAFDLRVPEVLGVAVESADGSFGTSVRSIGFAGCRAYGEDVFR